MPEQPRVSVLLPVRDGAHSVEAAIVGLLEGSLREIEVVAVDDGSSDGTWSVLQAIARRDPRLRSFQRPARGLVATLNFGLEQARTPLIARQDADDLSQPSRLERQLVLLESRPEWAGVGCGIRFKASGRAAEGLDRYAAWQNGLVTPDQIRAAVLIECPVTHATLLLRRSVLERVGGWRDGGWPEDHDLLCRLVLDGAPLSKVPEPLYTWVDHDRRLTRLDPVYSPDSFHRLRLHYLQRLVLQKPARLDLWGVGRLLERWQQDLDAAGHQVLARELNPRNLKVSRGGHSRIDAERLPPVDGDMLLLAYGVATVRDQIREALLSKGLRETVDFWAVG